MTTTLTFLQVLLATSVGGFSFALGVYFAREIGKGVGWLLLFKTGRQDKLLAQVDVATASLIKQQIAELARMAEEIGRMSARLTATEEDHRKCQSRLDTLERENAQYRGYSQGSGDAKNHAQLIIAEALADQRQDREEEQ